MLLLYHTQGTSDDKWGIIYKNYLEFSAQKMIFPFPQIIYVAFN